MFKVFMLYEVNPTTWFYLSSLMIIGIFFKFRRVWSIRNLDLITLLLLAPGMLMIANKPEFEYRGYCAIFIVSFFLLMRMLCDPLLVRRPLLEVNLSRSGMTFSCVALMVFLIAGFILTQWRNAGSPQTATVQQLMREKNIARFLEEEERAGTQKMGESSPGSFPEGNVPANRLGEETQEKRMITHAPGVPFFTNFANLPMNYLIAQERHARQAESAKPPSENISAESQVPEKEISPSGAAVPVKRSGEFPILKNQNKPLTAQILFTHAVGITGQIAIILGIILIGRVHFENTGTGIAAATLYLLLPYSAQIPARIDHIIPAALLVWAVFCYHLPALAGVLIGFAAAFAYYPLFLIPLWCSFYWSRGILRFAVVSLATFMVLLGIAVFAVGGIQPFMHQLEETFSFAGVFSRSAGGFWNLENHNLFFRIPVIAIFVILATVLAFWPSQKNLGTLMSSSAALMIGCQYCHPFEGGLYMAWYLPLAILVIFRPNLEDRIALRALAKRGSPHPAVHAGVLRDAD